MFSKSVTAFFEKSETLKNVLKKHYCSSGKEVNNWFFFSKSVTVFLEENYNAEKCPQKALQFFWEKSKKLKIFLKKRYGLSGKKVKRWKMSSKSVMALLGKK